MSPLDGFGLAVVEADVAHDSFREILDRGEDAAVNEVAFDLGEPELDLIEPGGVGGREVERDRRMVVEELLDSLGLVCGEVVENDVDFLVGRLTGDEIFEEGDELLTGVAADGLAQDFSGFGVERGVQRQGTVADVLEAMALGSSRGERQDRVFAIESLDGRLLIDTEDGGMLGRVDIQAQDVGGFALEVGIVGCHVALHAMGLDPVLLPGAGHHHVMDPEFLGQAPGAPVGRAIGGGLLGPSQDSGLHARREHFDLAAFVAGVEAGETLLREALFPLADEGRGTAEFALDLGVRGPVGEQQDDACDASLLGSSLAASHAALKLLAFSGLQSDRESSHEEDSITKRLSVTVH